jgi:hypothetical protein
MGLAQVAQLVWTVTTGLATEMSRDAKPPGEELHRAVCCDFCW